jgi:hypothetical protein
MATTKQLSRYGGSMVINVPLGPDQLVTVRVSGGSGQEAHVRIVGHIGIEFQGHLYGFTFQSDKPDFWTICFPPIEEGEDFLTKVVLECGGCRQREIVPLNEVECEVLETNDRIPRHCAICNQATTWKHAKFEKMEAQAASAALAGEQTAKDTSPQPKMAAPTWPDSERRRARRVRISLKGCIRVADSEAMISVGNMSRSGIRFQAQKKYAIEQWVQVAVPYTIGGANMFRPGRIVWRIEAGAATFEYGLKFTKD